jgi:hypothetical protein
VIDLLFENSVISSYMKKILIIVLLGVFCLQTSNALAISDSSAKQDWLAGMKARVAKEEIHLTAKNTYKDDSSEENNQEVIKTGRELLAAVLDEVDYWLIWQKVKAENNSQVSSELQRKILDDVEKNQLKVEGLQKEVSEIDNRIELGVVFIKMIGSYLDLLTDVARNSGLAWVEVGYRLISVGVDYENKLREATEDIEDSAGIISKLDEAKTKLSEALEHVKVANGYYEKVKVPGQPLKNFTNGNVEIRNARNSLLSANQLLIESFKLILEEKKEPFDSAQGLRGEKVEIELK